MPLFTRPIQGAREEGRIVVAVSKLAIPPSSCLSGESAEPALGFGLPSYLLYIQHSAQVSSNCAYYTANRYFNTVSGDLTLHKTGSVFASFGLDEMEM